MMSQIYPNNEPYNVPASVRDTLVSAIAYLTVFAEHSDIPTSGEIHNVLSNLKLYITPMHERDEENRWVR